MIDVREYVDARGHNHFRDWTSKQDPSVRVRIDKAVFRLGEGNFSAVKPEGEGVSALRLDFGPGYRVYFTVEGRSVVLLFCGGDKTTQPKDIRRAREYLVDYRRRTDA